MTEHLHYITHTHEAGEGIVTKFECRGDRTSPCHQYPPAELEMEAWGKEDEHLFVSHDRCWIEISMNDADCAELCGPDGEPVRSGPITATYEECVQWEYAEPVVTDEMVERASKAVHEQVWPEYPWANTRHESRENIRRQERAALEAALNLREES